MSQLHSYASAVSPGVATDDVENVSMQDSPSSKTSGSEGLDNAKGIENDECAHPKDPDIVEEEITFEKDFQIPPSFS